MIDLDANGSADRTFVFGRSGDVPLRPNRRILDALGIT
jgi:hypothetical protein